VKWQDRLPKSSSLIAVLTGVLLVATALTLRQIPDSAVTIRVEMTTQEAGTAELFVNGDKQWTQAPVVAGRQTISFEGIEGPFTALRVDPLATKGQRITIHRISVLDSKGRQLATYAGRDFVSWQNYQVESSTVDADGLTVVTATADAAVTSVVNIQTGDRSRLIDRVVQRWRQPWPATELVLGLPILVLAVGAVVRRKWGAIALAIGPLAVYLAIRLAGSTRGVTAADKAFGRPGWSGLDAGYPRHFLIITLLLVAGLSVVALALRRQIPTMHLSRRSANETETETRSEASAGTETELTNNDAEDAAVRLRDRIRQRLLLVRWARLAAILAAPTVYALIRFPSAPQISSALSSPIASNDWDFANLRTWDHLLASGSQPMVDYWYPYGNLGYLRLGVLGAVIEWIAVVACLTVVSSALWRLSQRATPVIIGTAAVAAFDLQFYTGGFRYLAPLAFTMWFATTRRTHGKERWFALAAVASAPLISPDIGIYTLAAVAAVLIIDELMVRGLGDRESGRRIIRDTLAIGAGWAAFIVIGLIRGGIVPSLALIVDLESTAAYVGSITPVAEMIRPIPGRIIFAFPFAAIGLGIYAALRRRGRDLSLSALPAIAGLGMFGVLVLAKHLIRPGLEGVLAMTCAAAVSLAIAAGWSKVGSPTSSVAAGCLLGALIMQAVSAESLERWQLAIEDAPSEAIELVAAVTWDSDETLFYRTTVTRERMVAYPEELLVADAVAELTPNARIFVLGDAQYLYPLIDSLPYWVVSGWDASPIREQNRVVDELTEDPPEVVVFDPRDFEFDGVPNQLRLPIIHRWVVDRYEPLSAVGSYELLIPREGRPIDWAFWRERLGTTLDLGRLPAATTAAGSPCELDDSETDDCLAYLSLDLKSVDENVTRTITVSGPSGFYRLKFLQLPGDTTLEIPLGRMWFWTDESSVFVATDWVLDHEMHGARDSVLY